MLGNVLDVDGNGTVSGTTIPGLGLIERGATDDLDALALHFTNPNSPNLQMATFFTLSTASAGAYGYAGR